MAKRLKLTNSSDEASLAAVLSGDLVFTIPYFQRPYKWKPASLKQLERDILELVDGSSDNHFLGAIIVHGHPGNPADPTIYEVIDGQQRITTAYLYICAVVKTLCKHRDYDEASGLFLKYLVINRNTSFITNAKLHSSKGDRRQLNSVLEDLTNDSEFASKLGGFKFKAIPATGSENGRIWSNYKLARAFLSSQVAQESIERLREIYRVLLEQVSVVQIDVFDPINGPKIFDSLNSRQEPMTTGDLVRNEVFARVADQQPADVENLDQRYWQPFYEKFKVADRSSFDDYFFPFGLIKNPNLKKSDIYGYLREKWKKENLPADVIIKNLSEFQDVFLDLVDHKNRQKQGKSVSCAVARLSEIAPASTYPFLMQLLNGIKVGSIAENEGLSILKLIESFLVRRAICGHEPTGLHAVFKRLWEDCGGAPAAADVELNIREHKTVVWPSSSDTRDCAATRPLYGSSITKFVLLDWNRSLGGDQPDTIPWIEHVLPETLSDGWKEHFSESDHKKFKDRLANLLPLSQPMNQGLGNGSYEKKRKVYLEDSMFKSAREFAKQNAAWTPKELGDRSDMVAEWVINRWPN